jgi:predicted enzyme related to lactoylglutathione lyase
MHGALFILYVADQGRAKAFYQHVLGAEPELDVPGMTEFDLGGATLGLMPAANMADLLAGRIQVGHGQRCELYLRRPDAPQAMERAVASGAVLLDPIVERSWGEQVGYVLDPDGHVLALAVTAAGSPAR